MKVAITDASIIIDLYELNLIAEFFKLDLEVHTTLDVVNELSEGQLKVLKAYLLTNMLFIHTINEEDREKIKQISFSNRFSEIDKTGIYLARKMNIAILSSDKIISKDNKIHVAEIHGMFWIFDCIIEKRLINKKEASLKLAQMVQKNILYQNNLEMSKELKTRIRQWSE